MEENSANDITSSEYENKTDQPLLPLYRVHVQGAAKHGESVMFTLEVKKSGSEDITIILREFEDFEWLHHNLITANSVAGVIVPPIPVKSMSDPKSAESLSKKQLGDHTKVLKGDHFDVDCKTISIYLEHMLKHPVFGVDKNLSDFLSNKEAAVRARINKGLINRLSSALDNARKGYIKDVDDYYSQQRQVSLDLNRIYKELSMNFNKLLVSQWRLSSSYRSVATELTTCTAERDDGLIRLNKILRLLSEGMEDEAASLELSSTQEEIGLGCHLDIMSRYSESLKDMYFRRISAMNDFTNAEKALEKAKPLKKAAAEEAFETAKSNFENSSEQGKKEIQSFTQLRLKMSEEALSAHAEVLVKISQEFYTQLFHTRKALLEMEL